MESIDSASQEGAPPSLLDLAEQEYAGPENEESDLNKQLDAVLIGKEEAAASTLELSTLFNSGFSNSRSEATMADRARIAEMCAAYGADFEQVQANWRTRKNRKRQDDPELVRESLVSGLIKNKLDPESTVDNDILDSFEMRSSNSFSMLLTYAMNGELKQWISEDEGRKDQAIEWFEDLVPDVSDVENNGGQAEEEVGLGGVNAEVDAFEDWENYEYDTIIVPGFTPRAGLEADMVETMDPERKEESEELQQMSEMWGNDIRLHPKAIDRLKMAVADYQDGRAPFVLLSGSNVWPKGTDIYESIEMKKWLIQEGTVPADRIIVDAQAKHSTSNIRNAGRYMLDHGMDKGLITTSWDQNFYFGHTVISDYARRSLVDMGVVPKMHILDKNHTVFKPGDRLQQRSLTDPSDM